MQVPALVESLLTSSFGSRVLPHGSLKKVIFLLVLIGSKPPRQLITPSLVASAVAFCRMA